MQRAITVLLQAITGPYEAAMGRASAQTAGFATTAQGASRASGGLGGALGGLSTKLLAGGGIAYGLSKAVSLLADYEDALVGVGKTTGLAGDDLSALGDELTQLAVSLEGSAEQMLGIGQIAAQLGVGTEDIAAFTEVVAGLASATELTTESAATDMARLMNIMNLPMSEIEHLGDVIVRLGNNMATTEPEILSMSQRIAGAGDLAGFTATQVMALAAAASQVGLEAEAGGTAISRVIREIETATQTGGQALDVFAAIAGESASEFAAAWRDDPEAAFTQFIAGLSEVRDAGGNVAQIFDDLGLDGIRVSDTLLRLSGNVDGLKGSFELAGTAAGDLATEVEAANGRLSVALENLWDELKRQGREFLGGDQTARVAADGVNWLTRNLDALVTGPLRATFGLGEFADGVDAIGTAATLTADQQELLGHAIRGTGGYAADAAPDIDRLALAHLSAAEAAAEHFARNVELADQLKAQTDPVFALRKAVEDVTSAQADYTEAVEEHGAGSDAAAEKSWALFEALTGLTEASLRVEGGFDTAVREVWALYNAGHLTRGQAEDLIGTLDELAITAGELSGDHRIGLWLDMSAADRALLGRAHDLATSGGGVTYTPSPVVPSNARATGGPTAPGETYLVGESGPELFTSQTAGRIVPAGQTSRMMGGGSQVTYDQRTYTAQLVDADREDALMSLRKLSMRVG